MSQSLLKSPLSPPRSSLVNGAVCIGLPQSCIDLPMSTGLQLCQGHPQDLAFSPLRSQPLPIVEISTFSLLQDYRLSQQRRSPPRFLPWSSRGHCLVNAWVTASVNTKFHAEVFILLPWSMPWSKPRSPLGLAEILPQSSRLWSTLRSAQVTAAVYVHVNASVHHSQCCRIYRGPCLIFHSQHHHQCQGKCLCMPWPRPLSTLWSMLRPMPEYAAAKASVETWSMSRQMLRSSRI